MKRVFSLFLILCLLAVCSACAKDEKTDAGTPDSAQATDTAPATEDAGVAGRLEGNGYDSPEDAVLAYIEALNRGDVGGMLSTFALESYVEHADPSVQINVRGFFLTHDLLSIPCPDDYSRSLVLHARYGSLATSLLQSVVECAAKLDGRPISFETSKDRKAVQRKVILAYSKLLSTLLIFFLLQ